LFDRAAVRRHVHRPPASFLIAGRHDELLPRRANNLFFLALGVALYLEQAAEPTTVEVPTAKDEG
jgi:hypothetical protein